jgi:putative hydrolase of the HAD superfamily
LAGLFRRVEIVSEKNADTYRRVLTEFHVQPTQFAMVGNSLRSDIEPVVQLGGWGIHLPYHVTWAHELESGLADNDPHVLTVEAPSAIPAAVAQLRERAA